MRIRPARQLMGVLLALAVAACGGLGAKPTDTPVPPTKTPRPTATKAPPTETPLPQDTATPTVDELLPLAADAYSHPSGAFTISVPDGWKPLDYDSSMYAGSDDQTMFMAVAYENVGVALDGATLSGYAGTYVANRYGSFKDFSANAPEDQGSGSWEVSTYLVGPDGSPLALLSYFWQSGTIVYAEDFGFPFDQFDAYAPAFAALAGTLQANADAVADRPLYQNSTTFTGPKNLFTLDVPGSWTYQHSESDDGSSISDTFTSPDTNSAILSVAYDDGTKISKSVAGQLALLLLKDVFQIQGIKVKDDKVQGDGSERLIWTSPGLDGMTFFETRGTTFLMLTWMVNHDSYDMFLPVWDGILGTYKVP